MNPPKKVPNGAAKNPEIRFAKGHPPVAVEPNVNLMQALLAAGLPVASSCRGQGVCAKCRVRVVEGPSALSQENSLEAFLRDRHAIPPSERISCQVEVIDDLTIDTGYW